MCSPGGLDKLAVSLAVSAHATARSLQVAILVVLATAIADATTVRTVGVGGYADVAIREMVREIILPGAPRA
jgi:uncharacterized membrane protein (DUF373 family)